MSGHENEKYFGLGVGFGFALGALMAILCAPLSGRQTRQKIVDIAEEIKDSAEEVIADITSVVEKAIEKTESAIGGEEPLKRKIQRFKADLDQLNTSEA